MHRRYLAYIRVSTAKQGTQGSSLDEQRRAIERYAQRHSLHITKWFEERETAAKRGRTAFGNMLKALEANSAEGVIIHKIDRSARNLRDWADLADLIDRGADVHFAHDALDLRSRGGRLSADIQAVVAADFIRNLRDETRKGLYGRLHQGIYPFKAPLGYLDMGGGKVKEIDPERGPFIQEAFELYATGEYTYKQLKKEMHQRGLRGRRGEPVTLNGFTSVLNNPFYFGLIHLRKTGETFEGAHKPLISKALYDEVQSTLLRQRGGKMRHHAFLFSRTLRCERCGSYLIGERQKGRYVYYRCHSASCNGTIVRERDVRDYVEQKLRLVNFSGEELKELRSLITSERRKLLRDGADRKHALKLQIAQCDSKLERLLDALLDGQIDREAHETRRRRLLEERRGLTEQFEEKKRTFSDILQDELEVACTAHSQYISDTLLEQRQALNSVTSNFSVSDKKLTITLHSPLQEVVNWRESAECDLSRDAPRTRARAVFEILRKAAIKRLTCPRSPQVPGVGLASASPTSPSPGV